MASAEHSSDDIYVGLDIGGTKCSVVIGDNTFSIKKKIVFETRTERGYKEILSDFKKNMRSLLKEFPGYNLKRIGISCGGPLDSKKGMIYSPPNLPGWDNVPITAIFSEEFGVETALQNDANACALAEWLMGAGKRNLQYGFSDFWNRHGRRSYSEWQIIQRHK